jgi:hypothetical protein
LRVPVYAESSEFVVNSVRSGYQGEPSVAVRVGGSFVVVWFDYSANPYTALVGQRFDAIGSRIGSTFQISTPTLADNQHSPEVVAFADGGFAVVWDSAHFDSSSGTSQTDVLMRVFGVDGSPSGDPFVVHAPSATNQVGATVTGLADGTLLVTWHNYSADQGDVELWARRFTQAGTPVGNEFRLTPDTDGQQSLASVAALPDGGFIVSWQNVIFGGSNDYDVYARRFDASDIGGDAFRVNSTTFSHQMRPSVATFADGSFVISWDAYAQGAETDYGVFAQRYDASGHPLGGEFRVPTITAGDQGNSHVTALSNGDFLVTWESFGTDGSGQGIYGRVFDAYGNGLGDQFKVNEYTSGDQSDAHAVALPDGRFAIVWGSASSDGSDLGISARRFALSPPLVEVHSGFNGDFNGDGRDDILWRSDSGRVTDWLGQANSGFVSNFANADANAGTDWHIVGTGDFNGDGRDDVLWRNDNGDITNWLGQVSGGFASNFGNAFYHVDNSWHVAGTGDFNGDGRSDVLWRNDSGRVTDWLGQANSGLSGNFANADANAGTDWHIVGTGDFNGDGRDDILWRNDNGDITNWLGQVNGGFVSNFGNAFYHVDNSWHVAGTGDFNGDGRDDILWRSNSGEVTDWLGQASSGFVSNFANADANAGTDWHIVGTGDFNGDGRSDILWRNDNGDLTNWLGQANGGFASNFGNAFYHVDAGWQVQPQMSLV